MDKNTVLRISAAAHWFRVVAAAGALVACGGPIEGAEGGVAGGPSEFVATEQDELSS